MSRHFFKALLALSLWLPACFDAVAQEPRPIDRPMPVLGGMAMADQGTPRKPPTRGSHHNPAKKVSREESAL